MPTDNIASLYEVGEHNGTPFIAMQYIDGTDLGGVRFEPRRACEVVRDVARALEHAHSQGIVHRDLKPDNIIVDEDGRPYVTDFGLAKFTELSSSLTMEGTAIGTPAFMSPEQALGHNQEVGPWSDIYALGATLYALLTGEAPFHGDTPHEILYQVQRNDPPPPARSTPRSPPTWNGSVCVRWLATPRSVIPRPANWRPTARSSSPAKRRRRLRRTSGGADGPVGGSPRVLEGFSSPCSSWARSSCWASS